ncbi:MAG: TonB-dependent receptor [Acidobacteria bacterium]|nr:TonB-dependent receptor [Acidobacteriota bacterium]
MAYNVPQAYASGEFFALPQENHSNLKQFGLALYIALFFTFLGLGLSSSAQNNVSGDIAGTVSDPTGAAVPGASVTATYEATGAVKAATTGPTGTFRISFLTPGNYHLAFKANGFSMAATEVTVHAGGVAEGSAKLQLGSGSETVEVTEASPLLQTQNAEITTEFNQEQISSLPNPGNDLTFIAQTSPGAVMNTQSGYGNFASFGLPGTSNTFTVNGGYENDPFLNISNSGASNLLLGNNDIATVTVLSNAYGAQYGGLGGTQVNEITRSGGNKFHGDATYQWNGSAMNGNDYFNNQQGIKRPRSNANQWSGAIGGPIVKDKTFFFFNTEGLRVIIPVRGTVYAPNASFIAATEKSAATQGTAALAFYQSYFGAYTGAAGYATATPDANDPNVVIFGANAANFAHEAQYTGRIDQVFSQKDNAFVHFTYDNGVQPTFTSLLNPIFDTNSPQPQYEGQFNETHVFNSNVTNQFIAAEIYYKAVFQNTNAAAADAIFPASIIFIGQKNAPSDMANNGLAETPGGEDYAFPQGRKVNGYQFSDDFSVNHGNHTLKTGVYFRRDDVTDLSPQQYVTPLVQSDEADFEAGSASVYTQQFPTRLEQPISVYNLGIYVQDQWKVTPNLVLTAGMRFEHNADPVCHTGCFDSFPVNFSAEPTSTTTPYSNSTGAGLINSGEHEAFRDFQKVGYEPRIDFAWTPTALGSKTVLRGGFGMFADAFPAQVADLLLNNAPTNVGFTLNGPHGGGPASPLFAGAANSFYSIASQSSAGFQSAYNTGGSLTSISAAVPAFSAPNLASLSPKSPILRMRSGI